ncbi:Uncharacterised protein [Klebsiella variicola]|nr:Uncharacterised protein [Klebsiella variicola]
MRCGGPGVRRESCLTRFFRQYIVQRLLDRHQVLATKQNRPVQQGVQLIDGLTIEKTCWQR